jgi:hypothetical protein
VTAWLFRAASKMVRACFPNIDAAPAAVADNGRYVPEPAPALCNIAEFLVRDTMPPSMPRPKRTAVAREIVKTLVAAGWRPTRS